MESGTMVRDCCWLRPIHSSICRRWRSSLRLHRRQIDEWMGRSQQQSLTMVPLSIYFSDGRAKVELALAKGRRQYDKRHAIASRDASREAAREVRAATKGSGYR